VVTEGTIAARAQHSRTWPENQARARAALASLRRAERHVVRRARPRVVRAPRTVARPPRSRGRNERRPGHRPTIPSRGPPGGDDDDLDGEPPRRVGLRRVAPALGGAGRPAAPAVREGAL
jgi:hypothetical protein